MEASESCRVEEGHGGSSVQGTLGERGRGEVKVREQNADNRDGKQCIELGDILEIQSTELGN